nr:myosin-9-like [Coffea arabica]
MRIRDLERGLRDEMQRVDALRRQLQDTHQHLFALKRQLKERVRSISMDCERRSLSSQLEEAREVGHGQAMRIRDLERGLRDEMQRVDALRRQLQDTHQHLSALKRQLNERVRSISMDCEVSHRPCRCWYTYSYPDEVVLAVDDERRSLSSQLEEAREVGHEQPMRIRDLERGLRDEMQRVDALRRQLQDTHQHLFALKRQLKERVRSISMDCEVSHRPCRCWYTYSYPDEVVLAVDDERRSLSSQLEEAREVGHEQPMRIRDLERGLRDEMQRVDALRRQLQDTHQHLFALKRQLKERVRSISMDCERRSLSSQLEEAREVGHGQAMRIRDLERGLRDEMQRVDALRRQLQDTHQHLSALKRQLNERVRSISMDCEVSHRPCRCWYTYSYPDEVVLAVDDERRSLSSQLEEAREVGHEQPMRIRDLERGLRDEMQRVDALRRQLQDTHQHLFALKRQLKERVRSISMDCEVSHRPCRCWYTYSYPDEVVLAVDDERRSLSSQLEEAREVGHEQPMRIRDLERGLRDEMQRVDALRRQLQDTHQHLFALKRQLKERVRSISMDCELSAGFGVSGFGLG